MLPPDKFLKNLPDGTIKQLNPFNGEVVWFVPGREMHAERSFVEKGPSYSKNIDQRARECDFCFNRILSTPPEISRLVKSESNEYEVHSDLVAEELFNTRPIFRSIPNLFPAFPFDYWNKNHSFELNSCQQKRMDRYLSTNGGIEHLKNLLHYRTKNTNDKLESNDSIEERTKLFFGGSHDLVVAVPHYLPVVEEKGYILFCSATMDKEEHFQYLKFTYNHIKRLYGTNPEIKYVSVFQNWLNESGASLEHLHKQLVGVDEYGPIIEKIVDGEKREKGYVASRISSIVGENKLIIAQKGKSILFADIGYHFPTITLCFTGNECLPWEIKEADWKDISELISLCYKIFGPSVSFNEEWNYAPPESGVRFPLRIQLKRRFFRAGGFEGSTEIHINQVNPFELCKKMVSAFRKKQESENLSNILIGDEIIFKKDMFDFFY